MSNVKIILLGDATEGLKYAPVAMWYAKKMRVVFGHGMSRVFPAEKGVMIRVNLDDFTGDKAYIDVGGSCPLINTNSFLDTFKARIRFPGHTPRYLINKQLAEELREVIVPPATEPFPKLSFIRTVADPDTKTLTVRLPIEATLTETTNEYGEVLDPPQKTVDYSLFKETYDRLLPTKFTGLMRRVVQATMATDTWTSFAPTINPVAPALAPINYQYGNSWGCVKRVGADGKNKYYFIEIGVQSVYYVPADYCVHKVKVKGVDTDAVILRSADTSKKVLIGTIPAGLGSSWDTEMGWAFSYDAPEASIVLVSSTETVNGSDVIQGYKTTSLLTLTFVFDGVTGLPVSASLHKTPPAIVFNQVYMNRKLGGKTLFSIVGANANGEITNLTADFGIQVLGDTYPKNYDVKDAPMYVYYTTTERQVCSYSCKVVATRNDVTTKLPAVGVGTWDSYCQMYGDPANFGQTCAGRYGFYMMDESPAIDQKEWGTTTEAAHVEYGFSCNTSPKPKAEGAKTISTTRYELGEWLAYISSSTTCPKLWKVSYTWVYSLLSSPPPVPSVANLGEITGTLDQHEFNAIATTKSTGGTSVVMTLTLSVVDRECVLIWSVATTAATTGTQTINRDSARIADPDTSIPLTSFNATQTEFGDFEATCRLYFKIVNYIPCDPNNASTFGEVTVTEVGVLPRRVIALTGGTYTLWYPFLNSGPWTAPCGDIYYNAASSIPPGQYKYTEATSISEPAKTESKLTIYSHNEPLQITEMTNSSRAYGTVRLKGILSDYPLSYIFMQAAFDPSNYVMHSGDLNSALVVKFQGKTYDVEHTKNASPGLFGFLGVV